MRSRSTTTAAAEPTAPDGTNATKFSSIRGPKQGNHEQLRRHRRRRFTFVRDAIEATGALTRSRAEHSLMASCPLHNDADPSLSVTWKPRPHRAGGAVLLHCFSCGADAGAIAAAIGLRMSDLFDEPPSSVRRARVRTHPRPRPTPKPAAPRPQPQHQWTRVRVYPTPPSAAGLFSK